MDGLVRQSRHSTSYHPITFAPPHTPHRPKEATHRPERTGALIDSSLSATNLNCAAICLSLLLSLYTFQQPPTSNDQNNFLYKKPPTDQTGSLHPTLKLPGQTIDNDGGINHQGGVGRPSHPSRQQQNNNKASTTQVEASKPGPNKRHPSSLHPSLNPHFHPNQTRVPSS